MNAGVGMDKSYHFVAYGKSIENLSKSIACRVLGFRQETKVKMLKDGATVFLYCDRKVFATATVNGVPFEDSTTVLWTDETYPYRVKICDVCLYQEPLQVSSEAFNFPIGEILGRGWGHKYVATPRALPNNFSKILLEKLAKIKTVPDEEAPYTFKIRSKLI